MASHLDFRESSDNIRSVKWHEQSNKKNSQGDLDWLGVAQDTFPGAEDLGYHRFMETVDVLVMGRKTYEKILSFGKWPYENTQVIILSSNNIAIPNDLVKNVSCTSESPQELCERLADEGAERHILMVV